MATFLFRDRGGRVIATVEAADRLAADLHGLRHVPGYSGYPEEVVPRGNIPGSLREAFRSMGLSESAATLAARGRGDPVELREPAASAGKASAVTGELREAPAGDAAGVIDLRESTPLEQAFRALGLSESAARAAARGRR